MADPEIQDILKDPQINIVLQNMQDNPARINESALRTGHPSSAPSSP